MAQSEKLIVLFSTKSLLIPLPPGFPMVQSCEGSPVVLLDGFSSLAGVWSLRR